MWQFDHLRTVELPPMYLYQAPAERPGTVITDDQSACRCGCPGRGCCGCGWPGVVVDG
jgi:hypothetical protein